MSERDDLARELYVSDNCHQSRGSAVADWNYFLGEGAFHGRAELFFDMADAALAAGFRRMQWGAVDEALQDAREVLNWSVEDEQEQINILHNHLTSLIEGIGEMRGGN